MNSYTYENKKFSINNNTIYPADEYIELFDMNKELKWLDINRSINIDTILLSNKFNGIIKLSDNIKNLYLSKDFNQSLNDDMVKNIKDIKLSIYDKSILLYESLDKLYNTNISSMTINSGYFTDLTKTVFPEKLKKLKIRNCTINQSIDYLFPDSLEELIIENSSFETANINYLPYNLKLFKIICICDDIAPNINYVNPNLEFLDVNLEHPVNINTENSNELKIFKYNQYGKNIINKTTLSNSIEKLVIENNCYKVLTITDLPDKLNAIDIINSISKCNKNQLYLSLNKKSTVFDVDYSDEQCIKLRLSDNQHKRKFTCY